MPAARVSVVIPVFRNEPTLAELHRRIVAALGGRPRELVFVDDASDDGSADGIRSLMAADPSIRLIALASNGGQQQAVLAGLREARGEHVVTLDADLQDPPEALALLLARLEDSADAAFATRAGTYETTGRLRTSRLFKRLLGWLTGLPAGAGMFLAMTADTKRAILAAPPSPFYLPTAIMSVTRRVDTVRVERASRGAGASQYTSAARVRLGVGAIAGVLRSRFRASHGARR